MRDKRTTPLTVDELRARELTQHPFAKRSWPKPRLQPKRSEAIGIAQTNIQAELLEAAEKILNIMETKHGTDKKFH
jgi:hypothetical protein